MRRLLAFVVATAGVAALACYPIESPPGGVAAITTLIPPAKAVVVGDTMRDSAGAVQPLRVYAFDTHGDTLKVTPTFVVIDSGAHVAGTLIIGDSARGTPIRVVGSLGTLQTPPFSIYVAVRPTRLAATTPVDSQGHTDTLDFVADTSWAGKNAVALSLKVLGGANDSTGVAGWLAWFHMDQAPASRDTAPGAYVLDAQAHPITTADTADVNGNVSSQVVLRAGALADTALILGHKTDSIVVSVYTSYKGQPLANSPMRFVIPVKFKGFSTP